MVVSESNAVSMNCAECEYRHDAILRDVGRLTNIEVDSVNDCRSKPLNKARQDPLENAM